MRRDAVEENGAPAGSVARRPRSIGTWFSETFTRHAVPSESRSHCVDLDRLDADWLHGVPGQSLSPAYAATRRAADFAISLVLALLTLPLMLTVAIVIRLESPGPVLFRQERVGLGGVVFTIFKFRSMRVDAESGGPAWAAVRDPRVTRVGNFLRRVRIDELPQLFNVLRGDMSLVGPRPERPHFVEQLTAAIPFYVDRLAVKPGITGWAQVNYPYGASVEDARQKLCYDLYYVKNRGPLLDITILAVTVRVVMFRQGGR